MGTRVQVCVCVCVWVLIYVTHVRVNPFLQRFVLARAHIHRPIGPIHMPSEEKPNHFPATVHTQQSDGDDDDHAPFAAGKFCWPGAWQSFIHHAFCEEIFPLFVWKAVQTASSCLVCGARVRVCVCMCVKCTRSAKLLLSNRRISSKVEPSVTNCTEYMQADDRHTKTTLTHHSNEYTA